MKATDQQEVVIALRLAVGNARKAKMTEAEVRREVERELNRQRGT